MFARWTYCFIVFCSLIFSDAFSQTNKVAKNGSNLQNNPLKSVEFNQLDQRKNQNISLIVQPVLIMLDPGHGGHDAGTQSISKPRYQEKSLNLATAQFVKTYLLQKGYKVMMTRETDVFVSLEKRAQLANQKKPTLFVSIHFNAAPSINAKGVEVFYYESKEKKERTTKSKKLAQALLKQVLAHTQAKSRGVKQGNYAVIRETNIPAVLIEGGFVTNEEELKQLKDPIYLKRLAWGITRGIEEYLAKNKQ